MNDTLTSIKTHIEFLGFEVTEQENGSLMAKNDYGMIFIKVLNYGILHTSYWRIVKNIDSELYKHLNESNSNASIATYRIIDDENPSLVIDSIYSGEYSKISYGRFLEAFKKDDNEHLSDNKELYQYLVE